MAMRFEESRKDKKRRRWKPARPSKKPELHLPPHGRPDGSRWADPDWFVATDRELIKLHERYNHGDNRAVLEAIDILSAVFPDWLRQAYFVAWGRYRRYEVDTLDQAFGVERPKGQHIEDAQKREELRKLILFRVYFLHYRENKPIDAGTFAQVADELGVSTGLVTQIFGSAESDELREILRNLRIS